MVPASCLRPAAHPGTRCFAATPTRPSVGCGTSAIRGISPGTANDRSQAKHDGAQIRLRPGVPSIMLGGFHEDCRSRRSSDAIGCSLRGDSGARRRDEGTKGHVDRQQSPGDCSGGRNGRGNRGPDRRETGDRRAGRLDARPPDDMRPRRESAHASGVREGARPERPDEVPWRFGKRTKAAGSIVAYRGVDIGNPVTSHTGKASRRARVLGAPGATVDAAGAVVVGFLGRTTNKRLKLQKGTIRRAVAWAPGRRGVVISTMDAPANAAGNTGTWWAKARGGRVGCAVGQLVALRYATGGRVGTVTGNLVQPIVAQVRVGSCRPSGRAHHHHQPPPPPPAPPRPTATTAATAPANVQAPSIAGPTVVGSTLQGSIGTWSGTQPIAYCFRWLRCDASGTSCVSISGATGTTYRLTSADAGRRLRFAVTGEEPGRIAHGAFAADERGHRHRRESAAAASASASASSATAASASASPASAAPAAASLGHGDDADVHGHVVALHAAHPQLRGQRAAAAHRDELHPDPVAAGWCGRSAARGRLRR